MMLVYLQVLDSAGDRTRFEKLYRAYRDLMFWVANHILRNEQDAEDTVHLAFLSLAQRCGALPAELGPKARALAAVAVLVSATLAKTESHSGQISPEVAYGQAGMGLFLREQVAAGESRATERGASVPKVLAYTGEKGEDHYCIEAETVAEIFGVAEGVHFREELNRIEFGAAPLRDAVTQEPVLDEDGNPGWRTPGERHDFAAASTLGSEGVDLLLSAEQYRY